MSDPSTTRLEAWPPLSYTAFAETQFLLHMGMQMIGKLKLQEPFQPQWAAVPLWLNGRGLTTGALSYNGGVYEVIIDLISHRIKCVTSWGTKDGFDLGPMSVADLAASFFKMLGNAGVNVTINMKPQEVPNTTPFDEDTAMRPYKADLVNAWWRILLSARSIMLKWQARFNGKAQPIGLMWGTLDIRSVFYNGTPITPDPQSDYIRRNAMNEELVEIGWWSGSADYPKAAFYSFTYPQPGDIENAVVSPTSARWDTKMGEFLLDYDDLRTSDDPEGDLLAFFESTCAAGMKCAAWAPDLVGSGKPQ